MHQVNAQALPQYIAAISAALAVAAAGACIAWPSPVLKKLTTRTNNDHSEGPFQLTPAEGAWIVALKNVGNVLAPIPAGFLMAHTGRKPALLCAGLPFLVSWLLVFFSSSTLPLYVARILAGIGVGLAFTITPIYLGEIAEARIRGALTTLMQAMLYAGILVEYTIGPYVSYETLAIASCTIIIVFFITFPFQPESPPYLVSRGKIVSAHKSLLKLRGSKEIADEDIRVLEHREAIANRNVCTSTWAVFTKSLSDRGCRRAFVIVIVLQILKESSGNSAVVAYASPTLSKGSDHSDMHAIVLGITMLVSTVGCSQLVDRAGRRPLLLASCCLSSAALAATGFAPYLRTSEHAWMIPDWLPLTALVVYDLSFSLGLAPIPSALLVELFSTELREIAAATASVTLSLMSLVVTKLFQVVADLWGLHVVFGWFSVSCILGAIFVYFVLPETKLKTLEEIQDSLKGEDSDTLQRRSIPLMDLRSV